MGKLLIGDVEPASLGAIDRLYSGDTLLWPTAVNIPTFLATASVPFMGTFISLDFAGPTAFFGRLISVTADLGQILQNTHPFTWDPMGLSSHMHVRADIEDQSLNGGAFAMRANNVAYTPGTWVEINPTSNFFTVAGGAPGVVNTSADTLLRIQVSSTPNGGNVVYDAFSYFSVLRT
jgi:hypothetical protein